MKPRPLVILGYPKVDHEKNYVYYWMPFSTLALANALMRSDIADVELFDGNLSSIDEWKALLDRCRDRTICVGLSVMTGGGQIAHALRMAEAVRENSDTPIVLGGPHVNVLPEQTLDHHLVDAVLVGPGQNSIAPFIEALRGQRPLTSVPGLLMKVGDNIVRGPDNPAMTRDLGSYPWHLIDVERYVRDDPTVSTRTLNYISSHGCVYKCQFCYELTYKRKYSKIGSNIMLDDVEYISRKYGVSGIKFYDADWFIDLKRANEFSQGLIERKLDIKWAASINPNDVLRSRRQFPGLLKQLARSGCTRLLMGVESGSDRVLNYVVRKEISRAAIVDVAREIARAGIIGSYTFIVGFPGETEEEQEETFDLIRALWSLTPTPESRVHLFAPYPGTPLFESALEVGFVPPSRLEDWARYDYYQALTPWVSEPLADRARHFTRMRLAPQLTGAD